jgi:sugar lactone lactonase YvrE
MPFAATTHHKVFSIDLSKNSQTVRQPRHSGHGPAACRHAFANPDNLAIDADGNLYIVATRGGKGTSGCPDES